MSNLEPKGFLSKICILLIVILAPFLGGATEYWSQSFFLILIALLVCLFPPRRVDLPLAISGCGLLALAGASFLPARWMGLPGWRKEAIASGIGLPGSITPQPGLTLDAALLLLGGLLWLAWLAQQPWSADERRLLAKFFCAGAFLLGIVALVAYYGNLAIPFWLKTERRFGPFPNRNQTGNFFAISAILSIALSLDQFRQTKKWAAGWVLCSALLIWVLVLSYSRAGIAIFFLGLLVWTSSLSRSLKKISLGLVFVLFLLTGFLLFGGETLERFGARSAADFRFLVWKDALTMVDSAPWFGSGLGNFDSLFPFFRNASIQQQRIIHPESDWLWLGAEMGVMAVVLVFGGFFWILRRALPFKRNSARSLRAACAAGAVIFMVHGFMDVSAHRLGTALPAIFVLALALLPPKEERPASSIIPWIFRLLALLLLLSTLFRIQTRRDEKSAAKAWLEQQNYTETITHAGLALREKPLDWDVYYTRGIARAFLGKWTDSLGDFRRANLLEPQFFRLPIEEGSLWLLLNPPLAFQAWPEALRRCRPEEQGPVYSEILSLAGMSPEVRLRMGMLASGNIDRELVYVSYAAPEQADDLLARLLPQGKNLTPARQKCLYFAAARRSAEKKDFQTAYKLAKKAVPAPTLPKRSKTSLQDSLRAFTLDPGNFAAAYVLYSKQVKSRHLAAALMTLEKASREKNAPEYFRYLAAELNARSGEWEKAWGALQQYAHI